MKKIILSICMISTCLWVSAQDTKFKEKANEKEITEVEKIETVKPDVSFNEGVDLVSIVFHLAGSEEFNLCSIKDYMEKTDDFFAPFKSHPVVKLAAKYGKTGIGYDAVASYGLHLLMPSPENKEIIFNPELASGGDVSFDRWTEKQKRDFLVQLNDFYRISHFEQWYQDMQETQEIVIKAFDTINNNIHYEWHEQFFGIQENSKFNIFLSLLVGPTNYGCSAKKIDGSYHVTPVIGCCTAGENGNFYYDPRVVIPIVIHEVCHHYCNPLNSKYWQKMEEPANTLFKLNKEGLSRQAYGNAETMMNETFVRASVIRYMADYYNKINISDLIREEEGQYFVLMNDYVKILTEYEDRRENFQTIDDIMPRLIDAIYQFDIKEYEQRQADFAKNCATYTCNIKNKSKNIPAGYYKLIITFSKPMANGIAIGYFDKPAESIPVVSEKPYVWSEDKTTQIINLKLEAGHHYGFSILGDYYTTLDGYKGKGTQYIEFWTK